VNTSTIQMEGSRIRRQRRELRILLLCVASSLAVHLLGYAWVASRKIPPVKRVPDGFMMVERWPTFRPAPPGPEAAKPEGETGTARSSQVRPPGRVDRVPGDVAREVHRKGILQALDALGRGPMAKGLPSTLEGGELSPGLPEASRAQIDPGTLPGRKGGNGGAPAGLGDLGARVGGGSGEGGGGSPYGAGSVGIGSGQVDSAEVDQDRLDAFVRARIGGLRACYESQLKLDQRTDGTVRMRFSIQPTGELSHVAVAQNTLRSELVAQCVVGLVRAWRTPFRPSHAVSVEYPFVFRPSGE
jgi:hypothetical protein